MHLLHASIYFSNTKLIFIAISGLEKISDIPLLFVPQVKPKKHGSQRKRTKSLR